MSQLTYPEAVNLLFAIATAVLDRRDNATHQLAGRIIQRLQSVDPATLDPEIVEGIRDTSKKAARKSTLQLIGLRARVYDLIIGAEQGLTNSELFALIPDAPRQSVQPRTSELCRAGWIRDSGDRRPNDAGHDEIVWKKGYANHD